MYTRGTIDIIETRATIDVFQKSLFGIVRILDAFYIRDEMGLCTTLRQPRFCQLYYPCGSPTTVRQFTSFPNVRVLPACVRCVVLTGLCR